MLIACIQLQCGIRPVGTPVFTNSKDDLNLDKFFGFCLAEVNAPDINIPILPIKKKGD
jgi:hypothetical protein